MSSDREPPATNPDPPSDLARRALAAARAEARRRGQAAAKRAGRRQQQGGRATEPTGPRPDERDPQPLGRTIERLVIDRGWETPAAVGGVLGRWDELVGPELGAHCRPQSFEEGVLVVEADSTAWATQVRLLASDLLRRLNTELGHGTVTKIQVRAPGGPTWASGPRAVRGGRGPRDTYG